MSRDRFSNPWPHEENGVLDILRWKLRLSQKEHALIPDAGSDPADLQRLRADDLAKMPEVGWRITWLGHASFLVQGAGVNLLIDPVFADYCSPVPVRPLRRKVPAPCGIADLPPIHAVLLTHSHYDHLDLRTLKALGEKPQIIIAEGHSAWLAKKLSRPVQELRWEQSLRLSDEVKLTATPAQHFTARTPFDRNKAHWCGWLIEGAGCKLWHVGDSAYCPAFRDLGQTQGPIDFAMIPIGAYQPRRVMKSIHMNPEEAVQAFQDARCLRAAAMHWGTFALTDEPMQEPVLRLRLEMERRSLALDAFTAQAVGYAWTVLPRGSAA